MKNQPVYRIEKLPLLITYFAFILKKYSSNIEQCIDGAQCDVELFTERRSYMEAINNLTGLINHGGNIQFTCKDSRILTVSQIILKTKVEFREHSPTTCSYLLNYFSIFSPLCIPTTSLRLIAIMEIWWERVLGQKMKM